MSYLNSILNPISYIYVFFEYFMTLVGMCSDGLGVRVKELEAKGSLVRIPNGAVCFEN
jgi:hypothetical protein